MPSFSMKFSHSNSWIWAMEFLAAYTIWIVWIVCRTEQIELLLLLLLSILVWVDREGKRKNSAESLSVPICSFIWHDMLWYDMIWFGEIWLCYVRPIDVNKHISPWVWSSLWTTITGCCVQTGAQLPLWPMPLRAPPEVITAEKSTGRNNYRPSLHKSSCSLCSVLFLCVTRIALDLSRILDGFVGGQFGWLAGWLAIGS